MRIGNEKEKETKLNGERFQKQKIRKKVETLCHSDICCIGRERKKLDGSKIGRRKERRVKMGPHYVQKCHLIGTTERGRK